MTFSLIPDQPATQEAAYRFFDECEPVHLEEMAGSWKGREWKTGHPMEGMLEDAGWYGKSFSRDGNAYPLVFQKKNGELFHMNPNFIPGGFPLVKIPAVIVRTFFSIFQPLLSTKKAKARLRMVEYRGKVSSAMVYDRLAIIDHFRKIDENTLIGLMDYKGLPKNKGYFFFMERQNI